MGRGRRLWETNAVRPASQDNMKRAEDFIVFADPFPVRVREEN
jgi:hypothetical protein